MHGDGGGCSGPAEGGVAGVQHQDSSGAAPGNVGILLIFYCRSVFLFYRAVVQLFGIYYFHCTEDWAGGGVVEPSSIFDFDFILQVFWHNRTGWVGSVAYNWARL